MNAIPLPRRGGIAVLTLVLAGVLFHTQVASALITRGDDAMRNGDAGRAVRYYERAVLFDAGSTRAADRLAFFLAMRHAPGDAQGAIEVATAALAHVPASPELLADRALAEQRLRRWAAAEDDFARAARAGHDARYDHLAGRVALHRGKNTDARRFFAAALREDPGFTPARVALAKLR